MLIHRSSAKRKVNLLEKQKKIKQTGRATKTVNKRPAVITLLTFSFLFSALYLVISLDTVIGVPEQVRVNNKEKTERATWYKPIPSAPIVLDKYIRYKKPRNFSQTENTVTIATVLKNFLKAMLLNSNVYCILFAINLKYNIVMKKFFYRVSEGDSVMSVAKKFSLPVTVIIKLNNLKNEILAGDLLYLESCERTLYKVKPFETEISIGEKFNIPPEKILSDNCVPYLFYGLIITL